MLKQPAAAAHPSEPGESHAPGAPLYGMYFAALLICLVGNLFVRVSAEAGWLTDTIRIVIGLATVIPLAIAAGLFWRMLRRELDEMLQRIVLEGLAFAFVIYLPVAGLYMNARASGAWIPRLDAPDVLLMPAILVAVGIAIAHRRYQ